ncbi:hypothetical protein [Brenneria corticis]|uniref:Uncharacterized protein n=1 Tax=Brenneria corticis TaxID=2173106 RepID=A0A2U1UBG9_9GAMM|nr:hypothetical protein [Brenneria sp. CFCC 11842]PWC18952.1 hypothetical protein DDT56_03115 [Brenneria sp. CFCC 11842]
MKIKKFNMLRDFNFLFPERREIYKNIDPQSISNKFERLKKEYCLFVCLDDFIIEKSFDLIDFIESIYDGLYDGVVRLKYDLSGSTIYGAREINHTNILDVIKKNLNKKMRIFDNLRQYDNDIRSQYKKTGVLCFTLFATDGKYIDDHLIQWMVIKNTSKIFFNNIRSLSTYKDHVLGYFWVILKDEYNNPYIHVNFYIDSENFNRKIGEDINSTWLNALNKTKISLGGIIHFTIKNEYFNMSLSKVSDGCKNEKLNKIPKLITELDKIPMNKDVILPDLNLSSSELYKCFSTVHFDRYLYSLAKESYSCVDKYRVMGTSLIKI